MGFGSIFHKVTQVGKGAIVGTADAVSGSVQQHLVGILDESLTGIVDNVVDPIVQTSYGVVDDTTRQAKAILTPRSTSNLRYGSLKRESPATSQRVSTKTRKFVHS